MKFYKITQDIDNTLKKDDIVCNSFYYGLVKCATSTQPTKHLSWRVKDAAKLLTLLETQVVRPLTKCELLKITPHLKKEILEFDWVISVKDDVSLAEYLKIQEEIKMYQK